MFVSRPARGPAVACDGPRYTNMYETGNETTGETETRLYSLPIVFGPWNPTVSQVQAGCRWTCLLELTRHGLTATRR